MTARNPTLPPGPPIILVMMGVSGAGKTTVFNLITGVYRPVSGDISFDGKSIVGSKPYRIAARRIARNPDVRSATG